MMSKVNQIIEGTSGIPLNDAAYAHWRQRRNLGLLEFGPVERWHETAHDGPTFDSLKKAYPDARDEDLKQAIKAAVKLERDCTKNFSYQSWNYFDDVTRAVDQAKIENPDFREDTYRYLWNVMAREMR